MEARQLLSGCGLRGPELESTGCVSQAAVDRLLRTRQATDSANELNYHFGIEVPSQGMDFPQTNTSESVINLDTFRGDGRFSGVDGSGFAAVIIDTGIDLDHPFFGADADADGVSDRIVFSYDFSGSDDSDASGTDSHGSHVTSILASGDETFPGIAPAADIIHLKVFPDSNGGASTQDVEQALQWVIENVATYNIATVNLALGSGNYNYFRDEDPRSDEFKALAALNVIAVTSAGNEYFAVNSPGISSLGADPYNLAVGGVYDSNAGAFVYSEGAEAYGTATDVIIPFTQRHELILDVLAPGAPITAAAADGGVVTMHGTSQAAPHVAGSALLAQQLAVQELGRRLTLDEMRTLLRDTGVPVVDGDDEDDNVSNTGLTFPRLDMLALAEAIMAMKPATVSGHVFLDAAADGTSSGDHGLPAWTVYLDEDDDAVWDSQSTTVVSLDVPQTVADVSVFRSDLLVSNLPSEIRDVNVILDITHPATEDLDVTLISPQGSRVELVSDTGGTAADFSQTQFDDQASTSISLAVAPFAAAYRPLQPLSRLNGEDPNGLWQLQIGDDDVGNSGLLNSWSLELEVAEPSQRTDSSGAYSLWDVAPGNHTVRLQLPAGWTQTAPTTPPFGEFVVTVAAGDTLSGNDFGVLPDDGAPSLVAVTPDLGQPVETSEVNIEITLSEPVHAVDASDLLLTGPGAAAVGTPIPLNELQWRFPVTGLTVGSWSVDLATVAGDILDADGNDLDASRWSFDVNAPSTSVLLSEIDPSLPDALELFNRGPLAVDLNNWTVELTDLAGAPVIVTLPQFLLAPQSTVTLNLSSGVNTSDELFFDQSVHWQAGDGGAAALRDSQGDGVDFVRWAGSTRPPPAGTGWNAPELPAGIANETLARDGIGTDTDSGTDWTWGPSSLGVRNATGVEFWLQGPTTVFEGTSAEFILSLDGEIAVADTVHVDIQLADVTTSPGDRGDLLAAMDAAILGSNVTRVGNQLQFLPTSPTSLALSLTIHQDTDVEGSEDFQLTLSNPGNLLGGPTGLRSSTLQTTVVEDDIDVSLLTTTLSLAEGVSGSTSFDFLVERRGDISGTTMVDFAVTAGGSQPADADDFGGSFPSGTLTFGPAVRIQTLSIPVAGDVLHEADEQFDLQLSAASGGATISVSSASGTILNDELPEVSITASDDTASEAGLDPGTFLLTRIGSEDALEVHFTLGGSAENSVDYTSIPLSATLGSGETSAAIPLAPRDDLIFEADETVVLTLLADANYTLGPASSATITLLDDEPAELLISDVQVNESDLAAEFALSLSSPSSSDITLTLATSDGSATSPEDYSSTSGSVTFLAGETNQTFSVPLAEDFLIESLETFVLSVQSLDAGGVGDVSDTGLATITDNDPPDILIDDASALENETHLSLNVRLSTPANEDITLSLATSDGTALAVADYVATAGELTIPAGSTSAIFQVPLQDNILGEPTEHFTVAVTSVISGTVGATSDTGLGMILDQDQPNVTLASPVVSEADGVATVAVQLSNPSVDPITFTVSTSDGTATSGEDYQQTTHTIFIPAENTGSSFDLPLVDDNVDELDEHFSVSVSEIISGELGDFTGVGTITILDDDPPAVTISDVVVNEQDATATFFVTLSTASETLTVLTLETVDITTTSGDDYAATSATLIFPAGATQRAFDVNLFDDLAVEGAEQFHVEVTSVNAGTVSDTSDVGLATILDDESPVLPPQVTEVRLASSDWTPIFKSTVDTSESRGYRVPHGAEQLTPIGWSYLDELYATFSEDVVDVALDQVHLYGVNQTSYDAFIEEVSYDDASFTVSVALNAALPTDRVLLVIDDSVTDADGNPLDGEWSNGVTVGSSGDGLPGGSFLFQMDLLIGDVDGNGLVDISDASIGRLGLGRSIGHPDYSTQGDMDGSGRMAVHDFVMVRDNFNRGLPVGTPSVPSPAAAEIDAVLARDDSDQIDPDWEELGFPFLLGTRRIRLGFFN